MKKRFIFICGFLFTCFLLYGAKMETQAADNTSVTDVTVINSSDGSSEVNNANRVKATVTFDEDAANTDIQGGDTITVSWPSTTENVSLTAYQATHDLQITDENNQQQTVGQVVITSTGATATFNELVEQFQHVNGSFSFELLASNTTDSDHEISVTAGDHSDSITVKSTTGTGVVPGFGGKDGDWIGGENNKIRWSIGVNDSYWTNLTDTITITDTLPEGTSNPTFVRCGLRDPQGNWSGYSSLETFTGAGHTWSYDESTRTLTITMKASILSADNGYNAIIVFTTDTDENYVVQGNTIQNQVEMKYTTTSGSTESETHTKTVTIPTSSANINGLPKGTIQIHKVETGTDTPISDVTFRIYKVKSAADHTRVLGWYDGADYVDITTDSDGLATIAQLNDGVYELVEISAPDGVILSSESKYVTLGGNTGTEITVENDVQTTEETPKQEKSDKPSKQKTITKTSTRVSTKKKTASIQTGTETNTEAFLLLLAGSAMLIFFLRKRRA
ncbi:MAG: prealbumin-like fold domain-containing protein [Catenisphaera adipataccumulans]|jgi:hypothetical protein|uniref:prealbumin-like fold domain-containing protein n=1 Tax=Catenisphaera adipataccumulans TaxID=700500 RepID=UPI003D9294D1